MTNQLNEVVEVDIAKVQNEVALKVRNSPEVFQIAQKVDIGNTQTVMAFGQEAAMEISKFTDQILATTSKSTVEDSGTMLKDLASIMRSFNPKDFIDKKPGFLDKIFKKVSNEIEKILAKYKTMDGDIQKIYIQVKEYEGEINKSNQTLDVLFTKNLNYYEELEKYIQAGELIKERAITEWIPELEKKSQLGDPIDQQNYLNALDFLEMVDQRVQDLEMAKMVSLQMAPQIKLIQKGNHNLLRKINSAFVVTLPVFKIGLTQAITMKRQKIQADAMKALDDTTNEMLMRNADNIRQNSVDIARLSGGSSIKIDTLEKTFNTIMQGIDETLQIETENKQQRASDRIKLAQLQEQLKEKKF
jgi:uncharacterized protein YaaN involved in tellurite resistance